jgi:hypothetical protein
VGLQRWDAPQTASGEQLRDLDFGGGHGLTQTQASVRQRSSVTSATLKMQRTRTDGSITRLRSNSNLTSGSVVDEEEVVHEVEPRARTAMLPPVMVSPRQGLHAGPQLREFLQAKKVDEHPLCWLGFEEDCIMTSCSNGECRDFFAGQSGWC